jgi:hypothetical protein
VRDDFPPAIRRTLAARARHHCSNPDSDAPTSGPSSDEATAVNRGVAAHITAASKGGPRYDPTLSKTERSRAGNGIWLCRICATLIDCDVERFPEEVLRAWKQQREAEAQATMGRPRREPPVERVSQADRDLFQQFLGILPYEGSIRFIDETNMAGFALDPRRLRDLDDFFHSWRDAMHEFLDPVLESKRRHLSSLVRTYLGLIAVNT